jgi:uncharacterized protein
VGESQHDGGVTMTLRVDGPALQGFSTSAAWLEPVTTWHSPDASTLVLTAPGRTDRFVDPSSEVVQANSPAWLTPVSSPATLQARVAVDFADTFDAGVLMVHHTRDLWAKLCFERSPDGRPMIVSVVTRGLSDDANAFTVEAESVWLRVSIMPTAYAFHASTDGRWWEMIRFFALGSRGRRRVGLSTQSPVGDSCTATFSEIALRPGVVDDIRSGA